jgi:Kdo2-lipid IVA lauroyltransferase/acyltransferase
MFIRKAIIRRILIKSLLVSCSWLPLAVCHALGSVIGWGFIFIPNRAARDTKTNIGLCFPEMTRSGQRRLVRQSLVETGKAIL